MVGVGVTATAALLLSPLALVLAQGQQQQQQQQQPLLQTPGPSHTTLEHGDALEHGDDFANSKWRAGKKAGTPTRIVYPPANLNETFDPAVAFPTPSGFLGSAEPGDERLSAEDAYPPPINAPGIARVPTRDHKKNFDALAAWGNLSPYNSLPEGSHQLDTSPAIPDGCKMSQLHVLHRHGARFPEEDDPPPLFAEKLHKAVKKGKGFTARGELEFLNKWRYPLGSETLVTLGRAQLFNLGASLRMKYGALLKDYDTRLPVFRTTSQHRMLHSALNFAAGFFGIPTDGKYHQLVVVEAAGFNNTLAPHKICPGARGAGKRAIKTWQKTFLKDARERLDLQIDGLDLKTKDVFAMLQTCAYETIALGSSPFCELFTAEEHRGLGYAADLRFHAGSYGSRAGPANGIGWVRELVARLEAATQGETARTEEWRKLAVNGWKWGLNGTLVGDEVTFPLDGAIYVDATHDTVIAGVLAAMNVTSLHRYPRLPRRRIPRTDDRFQSAKVVPFGANLVGQVIECHTDYVSSLERAAGNHEFVAQLEEVDAQASKKKFKTFIRWVLNDAVLPLRGVGKCPKSALGLCPRDTFVSALNQRLEEVDFISLCELHPDENGDDDGSDPEDPPEDEEPSPEEPAPEEPPQPDEPSPEPAPEDPQPEDPPHEEP